MIEIQMTEDLDFETWEFTNWQTFTISDTYAEALNTLIDYINEYEVVSQMFRVIESR